MTEAERVISAMRNGQEVLTALVTPLDGADLARGSGASEWTVADVLSHLGSGAEITLAVLDAGVDLRPAPSQDDNKAIWARWDAMTPAEQAAGFLRSNAALVDRFESLLPEEEEQLRIDVGYLPFPLTLGQYARLRLSELTLHGWDVRVAFDDAAALPADAAAALLNGEPNFIAWQAKTDTLGGEHGVIRITTSDPDTVFALDLGDKAEVRLDDAPDATSTLELPAEAWLRLVAGRLAPARTPGGVMSTWLLSLERLRLASRSSRTGRRSGLGQPAVVIESSVMPAARRAASRRFCGSIVYRGSFAECMPASKTPNRVSADAPIRASPEATATAAVAAAEQRADAHRRSPAARSTSASCPAVPWCSGSTSDRVHPALHVLHGARCRRSRPSPRARAPGRSRDRGGDHRQAAGGQAGRADEHERQVAVGAVPGRERRCRTAARPCTTASGGREQGRLEAGRAFDQPQHLPQRTERQPLPGQPVDLGDHGDRQRRR